MIILASSVKPGIKEICKTVRGDTLLLFWKIVIHHKNILSMLTYLLALLL